MIRYDYKLLLRCISDKLLIQEDPALYYFINQGCLTVDNMDDKEEMQIVDVYDILLPIPYNYIHMYLILTLNLVHTAVSVISVLNLDQE